MNQPVIDTEYSTKLLHAYANLNWDRFRKEYLPTLNNRQKWRSTANEMLKDGDLVWLIEDSDKRGYYNLGRVTETIDGSDGAIRSAIVQTNDGVYKRPVVKLAPVYLGKMFSRWKTGPAMLWLSLLSQLLN